MIVLGVHLGHDSCAALIVDGRIVADVQEERFVRIKHYAGLPFKAVEQCLKLGGITIDAVDAIAIASGLQNPDINFLFEFPPGAEQKKPRGQQVKDFVQQQRGNPMKGLPLYMKRLRVSPHTRVINVNHHLAHAASAYYTSGTPDKQLIITADGLGDGESLCIWRGENRTITPLRRWGAKASLGWFYSNVTEGLGWWHGDGEGKTMGLAPYGNPDNVRGLLAGFYPRFENGELVEPHDFGQLYQWQEAGVVQYHFDEANAIEKLVAQHGKEDISAEGQRVLEEEMFNIIFPWLNKEQTADLSCAGGIFLNVKLNQHLWETGKLRRQHIFPNAGDSGLAVGAALYVCHDLDKTCPFPVLEHLYFGNEYSNDEIRDILDLRKVTYRWVDDPSRYAAERLAENQIVAWFQGRMESGPRALGNRSILMSANRAENKDIINARVKFREGFRPFCPSLLWERRDEYLENARDEFFMITSFTCRPDKRDKVPAVVHADQTLRPQTVKRDFNERYWNLINEFGALTGEYLVMNTSFNLMGEPIMSHPRDAIRCFYDNGMDCLVIGNYVLEKAVG
jgi:carbamoyltransferase